MKYNRPPTAREQDKILKELEDADEREREEMIKDLFTAGYVAGLRYTARKARRRANG